MKRVWLSLEEKFSGRERRKGKGLDFFLSLVDWVIK